MRYCTNCGCQIGEDATFCPMCGTQTNGIPHTNPVYTQPPVYTPPAPVFDPYDHTEDFDADDIANTKLICMLVYLLDFIGIIIALMVAKESDYTTFHVKQSMKFTVVEVLICLATALLCWTVIVPIAAAIALVVLLVVKFVCFVQICSGKAKEPVIIRSIGFLK